MFVSLVLLMSLDEEAAGLKLSMKEKEKQRQRDNDVQSRAERGRRGK
jgi:hypothetical protein